MKRLHVLPVTVSRWKHSLSSKAPTQYIYSVETAKLCQAPGVDGGCYNFWEEDTLSMEQHPQKQLK